MLSQAYAMSCQASGAQADLHDHACSSNLVCAYQQQQVQAGRLPSRLLTGSAGVQQLLMVAGLDRYYQIVRYCAHSLPEPALLPSRLLCLHVVA